MHTESADESALRTALQDAVPPLQEPADRVAEIGTRVRRYRARTAAAAAALTVAVVLAGAGALDLVRPQRSPGPAATGAAHDCPPADVALPRDTRTDSPGAIVPSGAIRATLCERPSSEFRSPPEIDYSPRALTQNVNELVSLANSLPGPSKTPRACTAVGYSTEMSFVFGYTDRPPLVVGVDRNCGALVTAERIRYFGYGEALNAFYQLYRAQLRATTPLATIPTPTCPATHDPQVDTSTTSPKDGVGRNRGFGEALLPDPLAAMVACRYELAKDRWVLTRQEQRRTELEPTRLVLNEQFAYREYPECLGTETSAMRPTLVDSLWIADTTGAVSEVRVWRRPCAIVHTGNSTLPPVAALLTYLDGMLGTPS